MPKTPIKKRVVNDRDIVVRRIRVKPNQRIEIRPEKDQMLMCRFELKGLSKIGKLEVWSVSSVPNFTNDKFEFSNPPITYTLTNKKK